MEKIPLTPLFTTKTKLRVQLSGQQLAERFRFHFFYGVVVGSQVVSSVYNLGMDLEKGHLGLWTWLSPVFPCWLAWALWDNVREDLRQLTRFKLETYGASADSVQAP